MSTKEKSKIAGRVRGGGGGALTESGPSENKKIAITKKRRAVEKISVERGKLLHINIPRNR